MTEVERGGGDDITALFCGRFNVGIAPSLSLFREESVIYKFIK